MLVPEFVKRAIAVVMPPPVVRMRAVRIYIGNDQDPVGDELVVPINVTADVNQISAALAKWLEAHTWFSPTERFYDIASGDDLLDSDYQWPLHIHYYDESGQERLVASLTYPEIESSWDYQTHHCDAEKLKVVLAPAIQKIPTQHQIPGLVVI